MLVDFPGICAASLGRETGEYKVLGHNREIVTVVDYRRAMSLGERKLVVCRAAGFEVDGKKRFELVSLKLAEGVKPGQVRQVMRLKPVSVSICNKSTVVDIGVYNYWHRETMHLLGKV